MKKEKKIKLNISPEEIRGIYKDYTFDLECMDYDDDQLKLLKSYTDNLTQPEKVILQLYAEFNSQRKVASLLNVSRTTIVKSLNQIRNKILSNL